MKTSSKRKPVMKTVNRPWAESYKKLGQINPNNPMDNLIVRKSMTPSEYPRRAKLIAEKLKAGDSVLEIGCGYGGLAAEILKLVNVSYMVVDNKAMLVQAKKNLGKKVMYRVATNIASIRSNKFTMFISHFCLSDACPHQYRKYILEHIMKNCQKISVFDFEDSFKPNARMIALGLELLPLNVEFYINKYFSVDKIPSHLSRFHFIGERKE